MQCGRVYWLYLVHRVHCIQASGSDKVKVADISSEIGTSFRLFHIPKSTCVPAQNEEAQELLLTVGLWVVVKYDEFPGEITSIDDIEVNTMTRGAKTWKWPIPEDKLFCNKKNVLCIITPPSVAGNRGQFRFTDI